MHSSFNISEKTLVDYCQRHHIRRLSLFGSHLKGEARAESDVDLLVEFEPEHIPNLFAMAGMEIELSDLLGMKTDLRTANELSRYFREEVLNSAEVQYAA